MPFKSGDRVHETCAAPGTGVVSLLGAVTGRQAFSSICVNADVVWYCIADQSGANWEVGLGTWGTGNQLTRAAGNVLAGSAGAGVLTNFTTGTQDVFCDVPASKVLQLSDIGSFDMPIVNGQPPSPAAGLTLFIKNVGGRLILAQVGPAGMDTSFQPHLGGNRSVWWQPLGNATTVPITTGIAAATTVGATVTRNVATTNIATRVKRLGYTTTAATAGLLCGHYFSPAQFSLSDGAGVGGFTYRERFFTSDAAAVSGARAFIGMSSSTSAPTNVEPNTLTNSFGVAQLSTDNTQWYIVYGGSAAQTAIALGTALGAPTLTNTVFELSLFAFPNANNKVGYTVTNLGSGVSVSGTLTGTAGTVLPSSTTLLAPRAWRCNNATALAAGIDIGSLYIETDQ